MLWISPNLNILATSEKLHYGKIIINLSGELQNTPERKQNMFVYVMQRESQLFENV